MISLLKLLFTHSILPAVTVDMTMTSLLYLFDDKSCWASSTGHLVFPITLNQNNHSSAAIYFLKIRYAVVIMTTYHLIPLGISISWWEAVGLA
jgi:hypothetical protein